MNIKHGGILIVFLLIGFFTSGQQSMEFNIYFSKCDTPRISRIFEVTPNEKVPFTGISAYVMREDVKVSLAYRVQTKEGWGEWQDFKYFTEGETEGRTTFEGPAIEKPFSGIQFKSEEVLDAGFVFRLYYPAAAKKKSPEAGTQEIEEANCSCPQPPIEYRNDWCAGNNCPKDTTPDYTQPTHIIVHHSAGSNTQTNWAAVVSYIWDLHVNTNGWDDIGYNWLIDPDGVIYEGRGDSVVGAHFSCMNSQTTGICLLGNFVNQYPSDSAIASLVEMMAWEGCSKNISPAQSSFHQSSQLWLPNISGHRHGNLSTAPNSCTVGTVCPGDSLFDLLQLIRDSAASYACLGDVSLEEMNKESEVFRLYPNPAGDQITIELNFAVPASSAVLRIFDATGKLVQRESLKVNGNENVTVGLGNVPNGLYLLQLSLDGQQAVQQFIKE